MVVLSITTLLQLKPLGTDSKPETRIAPLAVSSETLWKIEQDAARTYAGSLTQMSKEKYLLTRAQMQVLLDSLARLTAGSGEDSVAADILARHAAYGAAVERSPAAGAVVPSPDTVAAELHRLKDDYLPQLIGSYEKFDREIPVAMTTGLVIISLALALSLVVGFFVARTVTRPIKALKAGTEKVSEALYESVPVTSNDEIADLTIAFNSMSAKLKQLDEMRMQLMSEISHEMRTPLQVIKAGCYTIVHTKDTPGLSPRQRDAVGMIHQATNRINQFVNSFLDIAKMEAGLMKFNFESLSLTDLLAPLVQEAQLIGQTRRIAVTIDAGDIPPLMIDKDRLGQVFSNLLSNALKYTPDEGAIALTVRKLDECMNVGKDGRGCVRVDVKDSGVGIPEADLAKLFNKFYQAKNVPLVNEKGSGLGLALVKHVTEAHGGKVTVASTVGEGSTFSVILPC